MESVMKSRRRAASKRTVCGSLLLVLIFALGLFVPCSRTFAADNVSALQSFQQKTYVFSTFPSEGMGVLFKRILTEAYGRLGIAVSIEGYPAERALVMSNQGYVDGEAGRVSVVEEDNRNLVRVPTPLYTNRIVAFSRLPEFDAAGGWDALWKYHLGAVIGYKFVEKKTRRMKTEYYKTYEVLFKALDNSRIDVGISEYLEALPSIKALKLHRIGAHFPPLALNPMYHYLHKKNKALVPFIDAVLQEMRASGRLKEILEELETEYKES